MKLEAKSRLTAAASPEEVKIAFQTMDKAIKTFLPANIKLEHDSGNKGRTQYRIFTAEATSNKAINELRAISTKLKGLGKFLIEKGFLYVEYGKLTTKKDDLSISDTLNHEIGGVTTSVSAGQLHLIKLFGPNDEKGMIYAPVKGPQLQLQLGVEYVVDMPGFDLFSDIELKDIPGGGKFVFSIQTSYYTRR